MIFFSKKASKKIEVGDSFGAEKEKNSKMRRESPWKRNQFIRTVN
jgi:hypothetical protein